MQVWRQKIFPIVHQQASQIIKNARLDKEVELSDISKRIKIPIKYLEAIESGNAACYPQEPYCSLFVKEYADFLGLNGTNLISLFRRDFATHDPSSVNRRRLFSFTPSFTFAVIITITTLLFLGYLLNEYFRFNRTTRLISILIIIDSRSNISGGLFYRNFQNLVWKVIYISIQGNSDRFFFFICPDWLFSRNPFIVLIMFMIKSICHDDPRRSACSPPSGLVCRCDGWLPYVFFHTDYLLHLPGIVRT